MSIAGGLHRALERGSEAGCSVVQIFLKNQLQWSAKPYAPEEIRQFAAAWTATGLRTVFAHSSYLINLAAPSLTEWTRAVGAFHDELERAEALALPFVIIHPGSHKGAGVDAGIRRIVGALDEVTSRTRGYRVRVLLENTAGGGELPDLLRRVRLGGPLELVLEEDLDHGTAGLTPPLERAMEPAGDGHVGPEQVGHPPRLRAQGKISRSRRSRYSKSPAMRRPAPSAWTARPRGPSGSR